MERDTENSIPKVIAVYHAYLVGDWQNIVTEQLTRFRDSGLCSNCSDFYLSLIGGDAEKNRFFEIGKEVFSGTESWFLDKFQTIYKSAENTCEFEPLNFIWHLSAADPEDFMVLYFHTKGASQTVTNTPTYGDITAISAWRKMLEFWTIDKWIENVTKLTEGYDVCGAAYRSNHRPESGGGGIFNGNFWWAHSSYIRTLPPPAKDNRGAQEKWICSNNPSVYNLYNPGTERDLYFSIIDPSEYMIPHDKYEEVKTKTTERIREFASKFNTVLRIAKPDKSPDEAIARVFGLSCPDRYLLTQYINGEPLSNYSIGIFDDIDTLLALGKVLSQYISDYLIYVPESKNETAGLAFLQRLCSEGEWNLVEMGLVYILERVKKSIPTIVEMTHNSVFLKDLVIGTYTNTDMYYPQLLESVNKYYPGVPFILQKSDLSIYENRLKLHEQFRATGKRFWLVLDHDVVLLNNTVIQNTLMAMRKNNWTVGGAWGIDSLTVQPTSHQIPEKEMLWLVGYFQLIDSKYIGDIFIPKMPHDNTCEDLAYSMECRIHGHKMGVCSDYFYHVSGHEKERLYPVAPEVKAENIRKFNENHNFLVQRYGKSFYKHTYPDTFQGTFNAMIYTNKNIAPKKNTIACVMIVKDEEEILETCLESVKPIVDKFIIVDTGSTDNTPEIIKKYGELYSIPFVDYVTTKNEALKIAHGQSDYVLWMDADERIYQGIGKIRELVNANVDCIYCPITEGLPEDDTVISNTYFRNRVWKNNGDWKFEGPYVHEVCLGSGKEEAVITEPTVLVRHEHLKKNKGSTSRERFLHYVELLNRYIGEYGTIGPHYPRAVFYLGRTYRDLGEPNLAVDYYQKYLDIENNPFIDERWQAAYDAADCLVNLGEFVQAQKYLDLAFTIDPRRAETHNLQGRIFELKGEIKEAQTEYKNAILPIPNNVVLFLNPLEYSIYPKDKVALLSYQQREYNQAAEMGKELIEESFGTIHSPRMAENMFWYSKKKNPKIFMMLGTTPEPIYGGVMEDRGVHGLETTYLELSEELEKIGCDIYLFCNTKKEHVYKGVYYIPWNRREHYQNICPDVMITSREFDGIQYECPKILWMQDIFYSGTSSILSSIQKIICSSQWHKNYLFSKLGPQIKNAIEVIPLGIRKDWFPKGIIKIKNTAMYTSSPDRGLDALITMWPQITERVPGIELSIVYGWDSGDKWAMPEEQKQEYIKGKNALIEKALAFSNIKLTGRITKKELYTELSKTEMVLYPSHFYETFCLSAIEAQYANATLITSDIGALQDVVNPDFNIMIPGSSYSPIYQEKYVDAVEKVSKWGSRLASTHHICNWSEIADKWIEMIWKLT